MSCPETSAPPPDDRLQGKVKITSDGRSRGTQVLVDGVKLHGVQRIEIVADVANPRVDAIIHVSVPAADIDLDGADVRTRLRRSE